MIAYDIGNESYQKKALVQPAEIADIVVRNFVDNLQRFAVDKLTEAAVHWLSEEFSKFYYQLSGIELSDAELDQLREETEAILDLLSKGDFRIRVKRGMDFGGIRLVHAVEVSLQ